MKLEEFKLGHGTSNSLCNGGMCHISFWTVIFTHLKGIFGETFWGHWKAHFIVRMQKDGITEQFLCVRHSTKIFSYGVLFGVITLVVSIISI